MDISGVVIFLWLLAGAATFEVMSFHVDLFLVAWHRHCLYCSSAAHSQRNPPDIWGKVSPTIHLNFFFILTAYHLENVYFFLADIVKTLCPSA